MVLDVVFCFFAAIGAQFFFYLVWFAKAHFIETDVHMSLSSSPLLRVNRQFSLNFIFLEFLLFRLCCSSRAFNAGFYTCGQAPEYSTKTKPKSTTQPDIIKKSELLILIGEGWLPKKVYEGDSKNVSFTFTTNSCCRIAQVRMRSKYEIKKKLTLSLEPPQENEVFLEMQMLAAAVDICENVTQRVKLCDGPLHFHWNCHFKNSGNHPITFVLRFIADSQDIFLERIEHTVKVVRLDHLTQRQVWALVTFTGFISGVIGLAELIKKIGLWSLFF
jgi:hypothetical protein